ncbi:hypothetical protein H6796_02845 [Candidatus Nomurabacteria bacterium]|nr:hypothetical protein [Candidatus Nomurabacteria bacterium]
MNDGISAEQTCAMNAIGAQGDFEHLCNPDGAVKNHPENTTFTLRDNNAISATINNDHLLVAAGLIIVALATLSAIIINRV